MKGLIISASFLFLYSHLNAQSTAIDNPKNTIQLSILLDVSGSMSGLIKQAQTELWAVVNEVSKAQKNGIPSTIEIALYSYGTQDREERGFIHKLVEFNGDVDTISQVLFALSTSGSVENCGQVISKAQQELMWLKEDSVYKVIFIAGNETFTQGAVNYVDACSIAMENGIVVNTIHCGDERTGRGQRWADAAKIAKGEYFWINANKTDRFIPSPYDSLIEVYNRKLNATYWAYGSSGGRYKSVQLESDQVNKNASKKAYYDRVRSKSKKHVYQKNSAKWDVNSKVALDTNALKTLKNDDLPEQLKGKTLKEKKQIVAANQADRDSSTQFIKVYSDLRDTYVLEQRKKKPELNTEMTLGQAISAAIRKQAGLRGFRFEE
jgi:hypothetical protein